MHRRDLRLVDAVPILEGGFEIACEEIHRRKEIIRVSIIRVESQTTV